MINKDNYFLSTRARFHGASAPDREPDYISRNAGGFISSIYWYTPEGVYRMSDHWSHIYNKNSKSCWAVETKRVASCYWVLDSPTENKKIVIVREDKYYDDEFCGTVGFCRWNHFKYNNCNKH